VHHAQQGLLEEGEAFHRRACDVVEQTQTLEPNPLTSLAFEVSTIGRHQREGVDFKGTTI